jgi:serine protease
MAAQDKHDGGGSSREGVRPSFRPRVVLKFHDWVEMPYEDGAERQIADRYGSGPWEALERDHGRLSLTRLHTAVPEERFRELIDEATRRDESYRPPNFFAWFTVETPDGLRSEELATILMGWGIVEEAYADSEPTDPFPVDPTDDPRRPNQGYLDPAPNGINAEYAWSRPGGDGANLALVDLEQGWTLNHEDLGGHGAFLLFGSISNSSRAHGTNVLGVICALDNSWGCIGITPNIATVYVVSHSGSSSNLSDAILTGVVEVGGGGVLLVEVQVGAAFLPAEVIDDVFQSLRLATALGVVVVEAAGNGAANLDNVSHYPGGRLVFAPGRGFRDSGAIMVGAATSAVPHARLGFSNFGARVDCYAWGENVDTTSSDNAGLTFLYTSTISGTSSASSIIAGAALAVQGVAVQLGYWLSPTEIRDRLRDPATGTHSASKADRIGVMPDLEAVMASL